MRVFPKTWRRPGTLYPGAVWEPSLEDEAGKCQPHPGASPALGLDRNHLLHLSV